MSSTATPHADLIQESLAFCELTGIKPTTFGQRAVKDRNFIERLQNGGRCWPETTSKVRSYISANMPVEDAGMSEATCPECGLSEHYYPEAIGPINALKIPDLAVGHCLHCGFFKTNRPTPAEDAA